MKPGRKSKIIFSVGGGKGGVGKSIFSVALGTVLAGEGHKVALVDLDLGTANLHTYLGITRKTPAIADFILRKVASLEDILLETSRKNLTVISGAGFVPGMANPAHWMKLKIMRHIRSLPADFIIMDLGAGVHFNTLDFFGVSDTGIIMTAPEPGAVMNAYGFVKGALFRKLRNVFGKHPVIGPVIDSGAKKTEDEEEFTLERLAEQVRSVSPDMLPLIGEIESEFRPALVINRVPEGQKHLLVRNFISLCAKKLGVHIGHMGNLPDIPVITHYLLNIPDFLHSRHGRPYLDAVRMIAGKLAGPAAVAANTDFTDEEVEEIVRFMEGLDSSVFSGTNRDTWRLRMYFKPSDVVDFLIKRGVTHEAFYRR